MLDKEEHQNVALSISSENVSIKQWYGLLPPKKNAVLKPITWEEQINITNNTSITPITASPRAEATDVTSAAAILFGH